MSNYMDLVKRLRQYDVPYSLRETAAKSIEDLLALLAEETCSCDKNHEIDPERHFRGYKVLSTCRYRQLVDLEKPKRTVLDELEDEIEEASKVGIMAISTGQAQKLLRLARAALQGFRLRSGAPSNTEVFEQHKTEREALRDIDPRLVEDE